MQKISSIHQFNLKIQQILGSHELKRNPYPKIIEATFSFPKFVASCKKSVYSNCSFLRYINFTSISQTLRLITPILDHSHPKFIDQNSFFFELVSTCKKSRYFNDLFWRFYYFIDTAIWLAESILTHIPGTRFLTNTNYVQKHSK